MLSTRATRRFAVHRCTSSGTSAIAIHPSVATRPRSSGWRQPGGERCNGLNASWDFFGGAYFGDFTSGFTINENFVFGPFALTFMFDSSGGWYPVGFTAGWGSPLAGIPTFGFSQTFSFTGVSRLGGRKAP